MTNPSPTRTSKPIPVTLNCSGGISLGAYMAGVFYELTKEAVKPDSKIIIDIITGASAGAMTGAIAAYYLLRENREKMCEEAVEDNIFYKAWVELVDIKDIDIDKLGFKSKEGERSVLSGQKIEEIAELLTKEPPTITENTKPLALLMTVTNLQGLLKDTTFETEEGDDIRTISSAENRLFLFHAGLKDDQKKFKNMWGKAIVGGRASGAFPVAFPPISDESDIKSYNLLYLVKDYLEPSNAKSLLDILKPDKDGRCPKLHFSYTDGGVLDGLPICKGIDLENQIISGNFMPREREKYKYREYADHKEASLAFKKYWSEELNLDIADRKLHLDYIDIEDIVKDEKRRRYVYIQPQPVGNLNAEIEKNSDQKSSLFEQKFSMLRVALKGLTLPKAEHDAIRLQDIRERNEDFKREVESRKELRELLVDKFGSLPTEIEEKLQEPLPYRFIQLNRISPALIQKIEDKNIHQLQKIYDALSKNCYIKEKLKKGDATGLLASDFFGAFGGFFDRKYRDHDFLLGRISGLTWLHLRCSELETSPAEIQEIIEQIPGKLLQEKNYPQIEKLKFSQWFRISRIVSRFIKIILLEAQIKAGICTPIFQVLKWIGIGFWGTLELLLTGGMKALQFFKR